MPAHDTHLSAHRETKAEPGCSLIIGACVSKLGEEKLRHLKESYICSFVSSFTCGFQILAIYHRLEANRHRNNVF